MEDNKKNINMKEKLKDKRERAKIELIFYGIFFLAIIIFARFIGNDKIVEENSNLVDSSFISLIEDNYEYSYIIVINDNIYEYYGRVIGNNSTVNLKVDDTIKTYKVISNKYYVYEEDNYVLIDESEVYPYIDYHYLNINNIREYINLSTNQGNTYKVKISDIILDSDSSEYIDIIVDEGDKNISIDYSSLFRLNNKNINKVHVSLTYNNIDNIISLDE